MAHPEFKEDALVKCFADYMAFARELHINRIHAYLNEHVMGRFDSSFPIVVVGSDPVEDSVAP